jgi:hypothetical protein
MPLLPAWPAMKASRGVGRLRPLRIDLRRPVRSPPHLPPGAAQAARWERHLTGVVPPAGCRASVKNRRHSGCDSQSMRTRRPRQEQTSIHLHVSIRIRSRDRERGDEAGRARRELQLYEPPFSGVRPREVAASPTTQPAPSRRAFLSIFIVAPWWPSLRPGTRHAALTDLGVVCVSLLNTSRTTTASSAT